TGTRQLKSLLLRWVSLAKRERFTLQCSAKAIHQVIHCTTPNNSVSSASLSRAFNLYRYFDWFCTLVVEPCNPFLDKCEPKGIVARSRRRSYGGTKLCG